MNMTFVMGMENATVKKTMTNLSQIPAWVPATIISSISLAARRNIIIKNLAILETIGYTPPITFRFFKQGNRHSHVSS